MAIEYCEKALEIARERNDKVHETIAYFELGHSYKQKNQNLTTIEYYIKEPWKLQENKIKKWKYTHILS